MLCSDTDVKKKIEESILESSNNEKGKLLDIIRKLIDIYSFVENQTYPRPSHPLEKDRTDAYFTMAAIIISLRTTLENERKAVAKFREKYKCIDEVAKTTVDELSSTIKEAGMSTKKAQTIIDISKYIIYNHNGDINNIKSETVEETRENLMLIKGIGMKSADCMIELGFDMPSMVVDINVFRTISRLYNLEWADKCNFNDSNQIMSVKKLIEKNLPLDFEIYQIVHTIILLHGKNICKANPKCGNCQIKNYCEYYKINRK
ncbi:MAG: hypothetical protein IJ272_08395 [Clostridia bacterium]|nr:hypothetical protein [Clostridia bacterium]